MLYVPVIFRGGLLLALCSLADSFSTTSANGSCVYRPNGSLLADFSSSQHAASSLSPSPDLSGLSPVHTLILCRHGDSVWNGGQPGCRETFTGWTDVPLSDKGLEEARRTGREVASYCVANFGGGSGSGASGGGIDACFTSSLQRARLTAHHCLWAFADAPGAAGIEPRRFVSDYRLNERHYGTLQGYVKAEVEDGIYGHDPADVQEWRRGWHAVPPQLDDRDERRFEEVRKYGHICGGAENVPRGESLEMVAKQRIRPFLDEVLNPVMEDAADQRWNSMKETRWRHEEMREGHGGVCLVVAHANSLRALIGVLCVRSSDASESAALQKLEAMRIQTGVPLVVRYRRLEDGTYDACDLQDSSFVDRGDAKGPDLPVWPLSSLPTFRQHSSKVSLQAKEMPLQKNEKQTDQYWNGSFGKAPGTISDANLAVVDRVNSRGRLQVGI